MSEQTTSAPATESRGAGAWKRAAVHEGVTLPSGTVVSIRLPNLALMAKIGQIPNELIDVALQQVNRGTKKITREEFEEYAEYYRWLVAITVVEPKVTAEELSEIPAEDFDMLVELATRQRDMDAIYRHIGGLEKVESFRAFRGLGDG